ncbi:Leucine aminopeptidase 1 [Diplonema papillatum]|nr:Leucine aminopeptidase 1 [Diplonema papillatum]
MRTEHGQAVHAEMWAPLVEDCVRMRCTLEFKRAADVDWATQKTIAVCGTQKTLEDVAAAGVLPEKVSEVLRAVAAKLTPSGLRCAVKSQLLVPPVGGVEEIVVGCVTTEASRHVSPYRGDQVRGFVKKHATLAEGASLLLAVPDRQSLHAYYSQASHGHSLCKLKGAHDGFDATEPTMPAGIWLPAPSAVTDDDLKAANIIGASNQLTGRLVDLPTNYLNTQTYSDVLKGLAAKFGFSLKLIEGDDVLKEGMGLLYHVGRAAEYGAKLAVLSHEPAAAKDDEVVCWAGKGIVYDTGGLQLKSTTGMPGMKGDMGGSAAMLGAFIAAVRLGAPIKLHALLALADNAVSSFASRPDDVHRCLSGKTVELNNTDAEGRLALSDAVAYANKHLKPTIVVNMATLTGAQGVACGQHFAAICSNAEAMERRAVAAGRESGDQVHPVLFAPELLMPEFESSVADHRNSVANRGNAQVSCAGLFIYTVGLGGADFKGEWLHIDMAGPSVADPCWGVSFMLHLHSLCPVN